MTVSAIVMMVALVLLGLAALLATVRLVLGPSALDRLVAVDVIVALIICLLMATAALSGDSATIPVVVATSLVGFLGSTTVARFLGRGTPAGETERSGARPVTGETERSGARPVTGEAERGEARPAVGPTAGPDRTGRRR